MSDDLIDCLLLAAEKELADSSAAAGLKDDPSFITALTGSSSTVEKQKSEKSVVHSGDTDSSDDEDNRYHEETKYNESGRTIKNMLKPSSPVEGRNKSLTWKSTTATNQPKQLALPPKKEVSSDIYTDPIFGIRIIKPLVSHTILKDRMQGRDAVSMSRVKRYVAMLTPNKDWVIAGVVVHKTARTSQNGKQFTIWTLSDLHGELKTVSVFLFGSAHKELWKTTVGTVVGVLNPTVFDKKDESKDEVCISVDNFQKVMIFGQSKDFGTCKSTKKNGDKCTAFVNVNRCEYCIYHVQQEYQKASGGRSELQANFSGRGLTALRNKVLGKNEVFYAGKSYMAVPATKSKKLKARDDGRLNLLNGIGTQTNDLFKPKSATKRRMAAQLDMPANQRNKDLELLKKLGGGTEFDLSKKTEFTGNHSAVITLQESKSNALAVLAKLKSKAQNENVNNDNVATTSNDKPNVSRPFLNSEAFDVPLLSGIGNKVVDLNSPISKTYVNRAKLNALKWVQRNGPIKRADPNNAKIDKSKKRALEVLDKQENLKEENIESDPKKRKIQESDHFSDRFKKMMAATSKHSDLAEDHHNVEREKYFKTMEMKERMEEKMLSTYKIECKAVRCLTCKYTNFSAADRCKKERHPLKVFDSFKRFFKCGECGYRTVTLEIIPLVSCKTCGSGKWERTTMMKEKNVSSTHTLSIRGGEQTFVNSVANNANLDLLVPDN